VNCSWKSLKLLLVAAIGLTVFGVAPQATAQPLGRMRLLDKTPVVGTDGTFTLVAEYLAAETGPTDSEVEVAIAIYQRVTDREALLDSIDGVRLGSPISLRTQLLTELGSTTPSRTGTSGAVSGRRVIVSVKIGTCTECISLSADGVYPISVDVRQTKDSTVQARLVSHMLVQRAATLSPLRVALILPMTGQRTLQPDGSHRSAPLTRIVAASESLASQPNIPLSVVLTPSLIDAARTDVSIAGTLDTLASGLQGREIIAPTYESVHPRLQHDGRLGEIMQGQWRQGIALLQQRFGDSVVDDMWVVGPDDELPDRDGLLQIAPQRLVVHSPLVATGLGPSPVTATRPNRKPQPTAAPVVFDTGIVFSDPNQSGQLEREDAFEESSAITAVISDSTLTDHLRTDDPVLGVSNLLADLTIAASSASANAGIAIAIPNQAVRRDVLDQLLLGVGTNPNFKPVTATELFALPLVTTPTGEYRSIGRVVRSNVAPVSDSFLETVDETRRKIDGVAAMIQQPEAERSATNLGDRLFSAALADPDAGTASHNTTNAEAIGKGFLDAARQSTDTALKGVRLGPGGPFRLTALKGPIGIRIDNATGGPVTVHLSVVEGRVRLSQDTAEQDVVVDQASQVVKLDVETRSSGSFDVQVLLTTPNGVSLSRNAYTIQSTGVSGIGVTLTLGLLGLLVLWWLRSRTGGTGRSKQNIQRNSQPSA
jgi:Family of unknown function (DUF6049)